MIQVCERIFAGSQVTIYLCVSHCRLSGLAQTGFTRGKAAADLWGARLWHAKCLCVRSAVLNDGMGAQGEHPKHRGVSDAGLLGTVERYFAEIMPIPRLQQRIDCFIFTRSFEPAMQRVSCPAPAPASLCRHSAAKRYGLKPIRPPPDSIQPAGSRS